MRHVLIVDDREDNRCLLRVLLENNGFGVSEAENGEEALERAREHLPDLLISDVLMPGMDGFALCRVWRADPVTRAVPFVFCTATYTDEGDRSLALDLGAAAFVAQPIETEALLAVLQRVLADVPSCVPAPRAAPLKGEGELLREYNAVLVHKLAQKVEALRAATRQVGESEARYRRLHESMRDCFAQTDLAGRIVETNAAFQELLGYTAEELLGMNYQDLTPECWCPLEQEILDTQILARGHSAVYEKEYIHKDGSVFPVELRTFLLRDAAGQPAGMWAIVRDIRERKQAQDHLAAREVEFRRLSQEFHGLLDAVPDHLVLLDPGLRIVWANRAATAQLDQDLEALVGQHCYTVWPERTTPCEPCPVAETLATGRPAAHTGMTHDRRVWDLRSVPLTDEAGAVNRVIEIARDVTEHRSTEAQLRQAQKMEAVGRLAGGVAHDFNNLLQIILGQAELALSHLRSEDPLRAGLQSIADAGTRATRLTRQLLAFARREVVSPRPLDLNGAVTDMEKMLRRLIGEDLQLFWKPGAGVWPVYLDPGQVDQLLANLVINARDAIADVGTVTIGTANAVLDAAYCTLHPGAVPGEYAVLTVSDTGVGMDRDTQDHIFEPFFTTKAADKGTGLGLATVYGIVKQAGGAIYVYSEPGQGTTFNLYLPRWHGSAPTGGSRAEAAPPSLRGNETVLLVEDEVGILELGKGMLERQGYRVLTAASPGAALLAAEQEPGEIHLLATDVVMPRMNGRELCERLQRTRPGLKCLYLSGYTADVITLRGVLPEGVNFLHKPFTLQALAAKVREVLDA